MNEELEALEDDGSECIAFDSKEQYEAFTDAGKLEYLKTKVTEALSEDQYVFEEVRHAMEQEYGPMETTLYWNGDFDAEETRDKADAMTDFYTNAENKVIRKVLNHVLENMS